MAQNNQNEFLKPLWRRVLLILFVAGWAAYEVFVTRDSMWMTLSVGMLAYGFWTFILQWPKENEPTKPGS